MTTNRKKFIKKAEAYLGVKLHEVPDTSLKGKRPIHLEVRGTTGVVLMTLKIDQDGDGWYFAGSDGLSPNVCRKLIRLTDTNTSSEKYDFTVFPSGGGNHITPVK